MNRSYERRPEIYEKGQGTILRAEHDGNNFPPWIARTPDLWAHLERT